jgi:hypothetical protein
MVKLKVILNVVKDLKKIIAYQSSIIIFEWIHTTGGSLKLRLGMVTLKVFPAKAPNPAYLCHSREGGNPKNNVIERPVF